MTVQDAAKNADELSKTLSTYMQLNEKGYLAAGKSIEKKLYAYTLAEVEKAFSSLLEQAEDEALKNKMKQRFANLKKDNFKSSQSDNAQTQTNNSANNNSNQTGDNTMADNNAANATESTFTPSAVQIAACKQAGITDIAKFKSKEELTDAIATAGFVIDGDKILKKDTGELVEEIKDKPNNNTDTQNKPDTTKDNGLTIDGEQKADDAKTNTAEPAAWIKKKIRDYQDMADNKISDCPKLEGYVYDKEVKDGFAASFNGGHIHYTSPNNVAVSKESGLLVFETLVTEPDNRGRPINFGPNLEHNQAVKLMAACLIHDNPLGSNLPKLTAEDVQALETELKDRPEDLKKFQEKVAPYMQAQQNTNNKSPESKEKSFDAETQKNIKEALSNQYEMADMEKHRKVMLTGKEENGILAKSPNCSDEEFKKYMELRDKQDADKKFLAEKFVENPTEMRAIINDMIKDKTNGHTKQSELTTEEKDNLETMRKTQISVLREKMAQTKDTNSHSNQLLEHDKRILALSGRLNKGDKAFVMKNGKKQEVKALKGEAKNRFEARNKNAIDQALKNYNSNTK